MKFPHIGVGKNNISTPSKIWEIRIDRIGNKNVLYISIVRFPDYENNIWNGFIPSVVKKTVFTEAIILDLRGNSGGDDAIAMDLAGALYGHSFEHPIKRQYRSQTAETLALQANRVKIEIINLKHDSLEVPKHLYNNYNKTIDTYNSAIKNDIPQEFIRQDKGYKTPKTSTGFKKPIYILMDNKCGSSCEFAITAFEWNKKVKKIGENTSGTFHFSNAGTAVLPNSKIKIIIPSQYSELYNQHFIERIGLTPDIRVPLGEDAYSFTRKILMNKQH